MQARNETMTGDSDEAQRCQAEATTRERTPRFRLIKLEERIAPGGLAGAISGKHCVPTDGVAVSNNIC